MQLVYCFISKSGVIENLEVNFGWQYKFSYNAVENKLQWEFDSDYINNFFLSPVKNITAIVGENGAGKSSLIEFLINNLTDGVAVNDPNAIIIKGDQENKRLYVYLGKSFNGLELDGFPMEVSYFNSIRPNISGEHHIVYYSNSFYDRIAMDDTHGISILSLSAIYASIDPIEEGIENFDTPNMVYQNFKFRENWRIIQFMQSGINFGINFPLPEYVILKTRVIDTQKINALLWHSIAFPEHKKDNVYVREFAAIFEILFDSRKVSDADEAIDEFIDNLRRYILCEYLKRNDILLKFMEELKQNPSLEISRERILSKNVNDELETFLTNTKDFIMKFGDWFTESSVWLNTKRIPSTVFKEYLNKLKLFNWKYRVEGLLLGFSFKVGVLNDLSSGEMALLTMLSRFYALSDEEQQFWNLKIDKFSIIIIDEGELYLHPSWQKKFINILVVTLSKIFHYKGLQIILTSHSPFVLSDLPKSKVVFMLRGHKNAQSELLEHKQTLAANIHTLLSDAFFMNEGFIGDYAKKKIDEVIRDLNTSQAIHGERREEIKKIIMSVGEPIIKRKLLEMYNNKFNFDIDDRLSKIEKKIGL